MYYGTFISPIRQNWINLPKPILASARHDAFIHPYSHKRHFDAYACPYKMENSFLPFVTCIGRHLEMPSPEAKLIGKLNLSSDKLSLNDSLLNFLHLSNEIALIGCSTYFELWNPESLKPLYEFHNTHKKEDETALDIIESSLDGI